MLAKTSDSGARMALRVATRDAHDRLDALFASLDLARRDHYAMFLSAQAAAHLPVELALDDARAARLPIDWPARRRADALRADLADLGLTPQPADAFILPEGEAALLGAIYVLEGSRLGGMMLRRSLPADFPQRFLGGGSPGDWRRLQDELDRRLQDEDARLIAINAACDVFALFERRGRHIIEGDA